jgi:ketosteroid isomerase-like protein
MSVQHNREKVQAAFEAWRDGIGYISDLLADDVVWTIVGKSLASRTYHSKQQFVDDVLHPFGQRFKTPFRPTNIRGIYADGDMVIVLWDGEGIAHDGAPYDNTYAWFLQMRDGLAIEVKAFFDSIAFNDLWTRVVPVE